MIVFESDEIIVFYDEFDFNFLLVTFSPFGFVADKENYWGKVYAHKTKTSSLGFVAKKPNWYPISHMIKAINSLRSILSKHANVVTYGASMGGYASLKFSNAIGAITAISFAPQVSINPADGVKNSLSTRFFNAETNREMKIKSEDVCKNSFVFYDPSEEFDSHNYNYLVNVHCEITPIKVHFVGHEFVRLFAGTKKLSDLLQACVRSDYREIRRLVATERKKNSFASVYIGLKISESEA